MLSFADGLSVSLSSLRSGAFARGWRWLGAGVPVLVLTGTMLAEEPPKGEFGKAIELAPFVVNGRSLSISIHARTKADRRYAEKFADEVVEIAYETLGDSTGKGLVIVGAKGEPHPIHFFRKFLEMARAGQLHPDMAEAAAELDDKLKKLQEKITIQDNPDKPTGITFETFLPAVPMPLKGVASRLYHLAWAEGFDGARIDKMLKSLTCADLTGDDLTRYDWVFYLPPHSATSGVMNEILDKGMKAEKMGMLKRAAIRSAVVVFSPVVKKAVEGMRKGMLFSSILHAESKYDEGDIDALAQVYTKELMPDLKPGSIGERGRALAAIEKQKLANAEYAKDPFVKPDRLATCDPATFVAIEGDYTLEPPKVTHRFSREGELFHWKYKDRPSMIFYPAGDRLLVIEDGSMTIRFLVDDTGTVTGVEERWVRRRQTVPRRA